MFLRLKKNPEKNRKMVRKVPANYQAALATHWSWTSITPTSIEGISNSYYKEFRRNSLVRNCIIANAFYPTAKGFETVLELAEPGTLSEQQIAKKIEDFSYVKDEIDALNKAVNLDNVLFIAQVKRSIFGRSGFEIVLDKKNRPASLLPLESTQLKPDIDADWNLTGFTYEGKKSFYNADQVLFFTNLSLEADMEGLSDIEPVLDACATRHAILGTDLKETAEKLWAPMVIVTVDVTGLSDEDAKKVVDDVIAGIQPGKNIAMSQKVTVTPVELKSDLPGLMTTLDYLDFEIIGNFKVPRFLIGREKAVNRATAYAELEAYRDGPITNIQRYFKRAIEDQWYDPQTRRTLGLKPDDPLPVYVKHRWNPISVADFYQQAQAVSQLWGNLGQGPIGGNLRKVWDLMGWDPSELKEKK